MQGLELTVLEIGLLGGVLLLFFVLMFYILRVYVWPWRKRNPEGSTTSDDFQPVSLIVYAEDHAEQLRTHLPAFLGQDYPQFEVIVVSDGLSEPCREVLSRLKAAHPTLYYTYIPPGARYISKKKLALTLGIKAARYNRLLFTEADCEPFNRNWMKTMMAAYGERTQLVTGFCAYPYAEGFTDRFIAFDNLKYGLQYLSAGVWKRFYGGTNKNLSYTKELFFQHKGFYNQFYLKSGEDSLFISEAANRENARAAYAPDSILKRTRVPRLKEWTAGRIMRRSTQSLYACKSYRLFKWESVCFWSFLGIDIGLLVCGIMGKWWLALLAGLLGALYVGVKGYLFVRASKSLQQQISPWTFLFFDLLDQLYSIYIEIASWFKKQENYVFIIEK